MKLAILASPVLYTRYQKNPLRILEYHSKLLSVREILLCVKCEKFSVVEPTCFQDLYRLLGSKQVSQQSPLLKKLILLVCTHYPGVILCQAMMNIVGGYDEPQLDWVGF